MSIHQSSELRKRTRLVTVCQKWKWIYHGMNYQLKRQEDIDWFDLFKLEHPDHALNIITQLNGRHFQGNPPDMLISGISSAYNGHINPQQVERDLNNGNFYLVAFGECHAPLLKKVVEVNDGIEKKAEWEFSSNTYSEALSSSLRYLINNVSKPIFVSAAVRQEAKDKNSDKQTGSKEAKETYWLDLKVQYENDDSKTVHGMPYIITFSDKTQRKGRLNSGETRINNIPPGSVTVQFGYPEAEKELTQARKDLQKLLDEIIKAAEERAKPLDDALKEESVPMQALILTGAFFDGLFGTLGDSAEGIKEIAKDMTATARVKLNEWEGISEKIKLETIEYIENKKDTYLEFIAEVDEKRGSVEEALAKGAEQLKKDLEELARYADQSLDNAYAYGERNISELTETYNKYALLFEDDDIGGMLKDFPGRYYDAMPKVEAAQAGGGLGFNVLTAVLTGGAGAGVAVSGFVASKLSLFKKVKKLIDKILDLLEKKKKTPESKINTKHNNEAKAAIPLTEKKKVEEKDKKTCSVCGKAYNAQCPNANPKIKYPSETNGSGSALTKNIVANPNNEYEKIEDHPWYFQRQQGQKKRRSLEAHHLIVSETMSNRDLKQICEDFGYNINTYKNGVMLPYYMDLACHLGIPLHRGGHDAGIGEVNLNYPRSVKRKVESLKKRILKGNICKNGNAREKFISSIDKISDDIFLKLKDFQWTLTEDGLDYDIRESKIGCGNQHSINDKDGSECENRNSNSNPHDFSEYGIDIQPNQRSKLTIGK